MKIQEFLNYRKELLDSSKDDEGFVQQTQLLSQILPLMVDAKLLDSEDWNDSYFLNTGENLKVNGYTVNESSERLQLFIVDESSIDLASSDKDLQISTKSHYDNQFKRVTKFLNKAIKGHLNEEVQDADPIRPLLSQLSSLKGVEQFDVLEIFLISATATTETRSIIPQPKRIDFEDENLSISITTPKEKINKNLLIVKKLIDLNFLYDVMISQGNREALVIDFEKLFDYKLEVIKAAEERNFESYLCVLPAKILSELYKRYSSRLLEKNVRSFLNFKKGSANSGIRKTIMESPEKFIAFNNGITITSTAADVEVIKSKIFIKSLTDFQIVNGGQTTASLYFTQKDGYAIDKVKIMAKINVALEVTEEGLNSLISDISKFSNSQTKVSSVDLSSRSPQLNKIKALSESVVTPSGKKWFFEKSRGEFNTKLRIAGTNKGRVEKEYPKNIRFTKEQLGKYYTAWGDQPYLVKKGGEKVFRYFIEELSKIEINRDFYENLISKIILFSELEKIYGQGKNSMGQIRSAVIPYTIAIIYIYSAGIKSLNKFDLSRIWKKEKLEDDLAEYLTELMVLMNMLIKDYSESDDIAYFSTNKKLWENISTCKEIKVFMASPKSHAIFTKYSILKEHNSKLKGSAKRKEVDFELIEKNASIFDRSVNFYKRLKAIPDHQLTKAKENKIDLIIHAINNQLDLDSKLVSFEENFLFEIRRDMPEFFDETSPGADYAYKETLAQIIQHYNEAIEKNTDVIDVFNHLEKKATEKGIKFASVLGQIGINLSKGIAPSIKELFLAFQAIKNKSSI